MEPVTPQRRRVVVNVDDEWFARNGVRAGCLVVDDTLDVVDMTFAEALAHKDWAGVDFVFIDLSHPNTADHTADEYPGVGVVQHVRTHAPGRGPYVILLTGEYERSNDTFILRRAFEAGVDHLMYRSVFGEQLAAILDGTLPPATELAAKVLGSELGLGVDGKTQLSAAIVDIATSGLLGRKIIGGTGNKIRSIINEKRGVKGVTPGGAPTTKAPRTPQLQSLFRRAARIDPDR